MSIPKKYHDIDPKLITDNVIKDEVMTKKVADARASDHAALVTVMLLSLQVAWADESRRTDEELAAWGWGQSEVSDLKDKAMALLIEDDGFDPDAVATA